LKKYKYNQKAFCLKKEKQINPGGMVREECIIHPFLSVLKSCKNFSLLKIIVLLRAKIIKNKNS